MEIWENVDDLFLDGEIFKDIDSYDGDYQISNYSRVKSFVKWCGTDVRILKQSKSSKGYLQVGLSKNGKCKPKEIHRLLFETFNDYKLKKGEVVHHINENKLDNTFYNLQKMTNFDHKSLHMSGENHPFYGKKRPEFSEENHPFYGKKRPEHSKRMSGENHPMYGRTGENSPNYGKKRPEHSKRMSGENAPKVVLTEQKIIQIRELIDKGNLTLREIAKMFGVHESTISSIKNRRTWKHI